MADPIQARAKAQRLAEALRANLKRRKEATRERERVDVASDTHGTSSAAEPDPQRKANEETA